MKSTTRTRSKAGEGLRFVAFIAAHEVLDQALADLIQIACDLTDLRASLDKQINMELGKDEF